MKTGRNTVDHPRGDMGAKRSAKRSAKRILRKCCGPGVTLSFRRETTFPGGAILGSPEGRFVSLLPLGRNAKRNTPGPVWGSPPPVYVQTTFHLSTVTWRRVSFRRYLRYRLRVTVTVLLLGEPAMPCMPTT